jgi:hypothetical protein
MFAKMNTYSKRVGKPSYSTYAPKCKIPEKIQSSSRLEHLTINDVEKGDVISYTDVANPTREAVVLNKKSVGQYGKVTEILWLDDNKKDTILGSNYQSGWKKTGEKVLQIDGRSIDEFSQKPRSLTAEERKQKWIEQEKEYIQKKKFKWRGIDKPCDLLGHKFYSSWGYDQTNTEMMKVLEVSSSGKTATCQRVHEETVERHMQYSNKAPTDKTFGDKFRMKIETHFDKDIGKNTYSLRGSYPFCHDGKMSTGKHLASVWLIRDKETAYETDPQFGH